MLIDRRDLLLGQIKDDKFSRLDLVVRKSFLDSIGTEQYDFYRGMYNKMQLLRTGHKEHLNGIPWVEQFLLLDRSFHRKGYLCEFPLIVNQGKHLINSSHRAALCLFHEIDKIPIKVCDDWENHLEKTGSKSKTYFNYGEKWFAENGFSSTELSVINKNKSKLFEELNLFFYVILWPPAKNYFDEIISDVQQNYTIFSKTHAQIESLERFIEEIYKVDNISDWKLKKKINSIKTNTNNTEIVVLKVDLFSTKFREKTNFKNCVIAIEAEKIKKTIREKYKRKINNYFHDIIIHTADNYLHVDHIKQVLKNYNVRG